RALTTVEGVLGSQHPHLAVALNGLAELYIHERRYAEAEAVLKRALAIDESALGPEHPHVVIVLKNLVALDYIQGRNAEALDPIRRAAAIVRTRFIAGGSESELRSERY